MVDQHELDLVLYYWGTDCSEPRGDSFSGGGDPDAAAARACIVAALDNNLNGEEFVTYMLECLCEHGLIDCDP